MFPTYFGFFLNRPDPVYLKRLRIHSRNLLFGLRATAISQWKVYLSNTFKSYLIDLRFIEFALFQMRAIKKY